MRKIISNTTPIISLLKINKLELLKAIGSEEFTEKSKQLYGFPDFETIAAARENLVKKPYPLSEERKIKSLFSFVKRY